MSLISIAKGSLQLAGLLRRPENASSLAPGLVVVHPGGGVKEQTANLYAHRMSQQGFVSVAFDALYQGQSEGSPRHLEDPGSRVSDVSSVVDYLQTLDYVNPDAITVLGICAGGGYGIAAAATDHRIKAVAAISLVNIGDTNRQGWLNTLNISDAYAAVKSAAGDIQDIVRDGNITYLQYIPDPPQSDTPPDLVDAWDYYRTPRGFYNTSENRMHPASVPLIYRFDSWHLTDLFLSQPTILIAGEDADSRWGTDDIYEKIKDSNPNAVKILVPGGRHMDFYDREPYVTPSVANVTEFFKAHLKL